MINNIGDIFKIPELRKRIAFTLGMLAVYRFGIFVSTPGIDVVAIRNMFEGNTLFGLVNLFSGGALENFSIFTLGVAPYISVSIIVQLLTPVVPALEALRKEGDSGRRILTRYTRQGTILLALIQSFFIAKGLQGQPGLVIAPGWVFLITTMMTFTAGTSFIMWLGEQITEKGLGNGISILIFAGIVARMPAVLFSTMALVRAGEIQWGAMLLILAFSVITVAFIVHVERSARKIPVQYPRRMVGKRMTQAQTQHMPLKVNMSGVIPPIFASAFISIPAMILQFSQNEKFQAFRDELLPGRWPYEMTFVFLVIFFCFFYTSVVFNPEEVAENLKKNGGFIPSIRPGKQTSDYLYAVLSRITVWGSIYISLVCVIPHLVYQYFNAISFSSVFGGTAVLIAVGVTLDTLSQIQSMVIARNYEAFMSRSTKLRGGLGSMSYSRSRILKR